MSADDQIAAITANLERLQEVKRKRQAALASTYVDEAKQLEALGDVFMGSNRPEAALEHFTAARDLLADKPFLQDEVIGLMRIMADLEVKRDKAAGIKP
jgi:hypothetical protein